MEKACLNQHLKSSQVAGPIYKEYPSFYKVYFNEKERSVAYLLAILPPANLIGNISQK